MEYFQVRYDSRVVNYDRWGFIRLATGHTESLFKQTQPDFKRQWLIADMGASKQTEVGRKKIIFLPTR